MEHRHVIITGHPSAGCRCLGLVSQIFWIPASFQQQHSPPRLRQSRCQRTAPGPGADDNILRALLLPIRQDISPASLVHSIVALLEATDYAFSIDKTSTDDHS